jgi:hypothetical protein
MKSVEKRLKKYILINDGHKINHEHFSIAVA